MTNTSRARSCQAQASHRRQVFLSFVLAILMGGSCLADGGKKQAGSDRSGGVQSMASSSGSYVYALVDGRFEAVNGPGLYNRPLYGPHCRDLDSFEERVLAVVGDRPDALVILTNWRVPGGGGCSAAKLGHFFLGLRDAQGGKWFHSFKTIKARYLPYGASALPAIDFSPVAGLGHEYVLAVRHGKTVEVRDPQGLFAHGRKLYFVIAAATNPMQSQIENARITVSLAGGVNRVLPLVNPYNLDDWLCVPYAQTGLVQALGEKTHALVLDVDFCQPCEIRSLELECLSNEVLVGLLGVTVL